MQKLFQNKNITQKIIIALVIVILFNFISPCVVQATDYNIIADGLAWVLVRITDAVQWIMLFCLTGETTMLMGHAFWDGLQENRDNWRLELIEAETVVENLKLSAVTGAALVVNPFGAIPLAIKNISRWITNNGITGKKATIEWPQRHILAPEDIFTGNILITNINFFKDYTKRGEDAIASKASDLGSGENAILDFSSEGEAANLEKLRKAIAKWYIAIRNIAIVGLLSVLVYVAIRMVISVASSDKAKYQKMLTDWLVALCLVFSMHYIMAITIGVCERLTELMNKQINSGVYMEYGDAFKFDKDNDYGYDATQHEKLDNLAMKVRIYTRSSNSTKALSYAFMYVAITAWTLVYFAIYIKRFVYMAFYTLMAPIVALTYPLDKIGDGRSQAFDGWLKEYIYTALKQPFHLLLYMVFIGMAQEIASSNIIYTIVVLWAMAQLDGTLAKWIGVDQASSTGSTVKDAFQSLMQVKAVQSLANGFANKGDSKAGQSKEEKTSGIKTKDNGVNGYSPNEDLINTQENDDMDESDTEIGYNNQQEQFSSEQAQRTPNSIPTSIPSSNSRTRQNTTGNVFARKTKEPGKFTRKIKENNRINNRINKIADWVKDNESGAKKLGVIAKYAGRSAVKIAGATGKALKTGVGLTVATGAFLSGGGVPGALEAKNLTDSAFDFAERRVNDVTQLPKNIKNAAENISNTFTNMSYEMADKQEKERIEAEQYYKEYMKNATKEEKKKAEEKYEASGLDMDAVKRYLYKTKLNPVKNYKSAINGVNNANRMYQAHGNLMNNPYDAIDYMAEGRKYAEMGYKLEDLSKVNENAKKTGYKHSNLIGEAFVCEEGMGSTYGSNGWKESIKKANSTKTERERQQSFNDLQRQYMETYIRNNPPHSNGYENTNGGGI